MRTMKQELDALFNDLAAELHSRVPEDTGEAMTLLDELSVDYKYIMDMDEDEQNTALLRRARSEFGWLVSAAIRLLDEFRP